MKKPRKTFYHSTTSRREFLQLVGAGAAVMGMGAAGHTKLFKDADEMLDSPVATRKLPFWIKEVDTPTCEIDWDIMQRSSMHENMFVSFPKYGDMAEFEHRMKESMQKKMEGAINNVPGYSVRDQALSAAAEWGFWNQYVPWTGIPLSKTPEENGYPRWEGPPEENSRMIRVAARYFGASDVGFLQVDEKVKKLIFTHMQIDPSSTDHFTGGRPILFEDAEKAYATPEKVVIPNKDLWAMVFEMPQSLIGNLMGEYGNFGNNAAMAYANTYMFTFRMHDFIHALGYDHMGGCGMEVAPTAALGVLSGLGELGRTMRLVSPKHGNCIRSTVVLLTDLPLAVTKPINAGIWKFCQTCKRCAEACPSGCVSNLDEPSWDIKGPWNNPGVKGYYSDDPKCFPFFTYGCSLCHSVCPYNKMDQATLHEVVKATISGAPVFNGAMRTLDEVFDYGHQMDPTKFWEMEDLPLYGLDPSRSS